MSSANTLGTLVTINSVYPIAGNINLTSTSHTVTITPGVGTIDLEVAGGGAIDTIDGDSGSVSGSTITITGGTSGAYFTGSGTTLTESFKYLSLPNTTSAILGVIDIDGVSFMHAYPGIADTNTFVGSASGNFTLSGATNNTGLGAGSLASITTDSFSVAVGSGSMALAAGSLHNTALGTFSLSAVTSGSNNIAIGYQAAVAYTGVESSNVIIGSPGIIGDSHQIRIGVQGTAAGQQDLCTIAGIYGNSPSGTAQIVYVDTDGTMSSAVSGLTTLKYTNVNTSPYVVLATDEYLSVDCSSIPIQLNFSNAATSGRTFIIKDRTGSSGSNNITVTTVGGAVDIDGSVTYVMNTAYESVELMGNGTSYEVF